jgi:hypothetical protein
MTLDGKAQKEALVFLDFFGDLPDPRQPGKVIYPLPEVLLLCLLAVLSGAEDFVTIARWGTGRASLLPIWHPMHFRAATRTCFPTTL